MRVARLFGLSRLNERASPSWSRTNASVSSTAASSALSFLRPNVAHTIGPTSASNSHRPIDLAAVQDRVTRQIREPAHGLRRRVDHDRPLAVLRVDQRLHLAPVRGDRVEAAHERVLRLRRRLERANASTSSGSSSRSLPASAGTSPAARPPASSPSRRAPRTTGTRLTSPGRPSGRSGARAP